MARFFTMLTFALIAATQTAQAFPHYTDFSGRLKATHDKSRNAVRRGPVSIDGTRLSRISCGRRKLIPVV